MHAVQQSNMWHGDRSFSAAAPHFWNSLPVALQNNSITLPLFNRHLKRCLAAVYCNCCICAPCIP